MNEMTCCQVCAVYSPQNDEKISVKSAVWSESSEVILITVFLECPYCGEPKGVLNVGF